ncbi:Structural maintenance of chromosome protein 1 [Pseudoloma neurophilia]|uniref:Structural maintenance of chromosome protein 1 n=1 Tax=Pseudoloma neurophilia TaxID=146866 RepID=A0A0R0M3P6_9MICR|nr:Structural maintenance of chromosome protein 1 [Pseudoloma neurophilia]
MTIKSLKLVNFKSHKNTTIEFTHYTCLIGLNGSGKSNVLDALKFVFCHEFPGENENNSERPIVRKSEQNEMNTKKELFKNQYYHNGTNNVEVEAVFEKATDRIVLKRKVQKSGDTEKETFFLNSESVSLKMYKDFITTLKLDYSIISQNSSSRIQIFDNLAFHIEHISGSIKYKKSYDDITARIKQETSALKTIFKKIKIRTQNIEKSELVTQKQKELDDLQTRKMNLEKDLYFIKLQIRDREIFVYERELEELDQEISIKKREIHLLEESTKKVRDEINKNQIEYLEIKNNYKKTISAENENLPLLKQQKEKELKQLSSTIAKMEKETNNKENEKALKKIREQYYTLLHTFKLNNSDLIKREQILSESHQKTIQNEKSLQKINKNIEKNKKLHQGKNLRLEELKTKVQPVDLQKYNDLKNKERELNDILSFYLIHKNNIKIESSKSQIIETLQALFSGVKGKISDLIKINQQKYKIAIQSFLTNKNAIVVDTKETAIKCINYLESKKLCRLTFYCIDSFKHTSKEIESPEHAFVVSAIDCVTFSDDLKPIISYFLENCYILMDNSRKEEVLTEIGDQKIKLATLQGTVFQNNYITGGPVTVNLDSNIITELNQISEKIQALDHISVVVERIDEIKEEIKILTIETSELMKEQERLTDNNQKMIKDLREYEEVQNLIINLKNNQFAPLLKDNFQTLDDLETFLDSEKIEKNKNEKKGILDGLIFEKNTLLNEIKDIDQRITAISNERNLKKNFFRISQAIQDLRNKFENQRQENEEATAYLSEKVKRQLFLRDQIEKLQIEKEEITQEALIDEIIDIEPHLEMVSLSADRLSSSLRSSQSVASGKQQIAQKENELALIKSKIDEIYAFCAPTTKTNKAEAETLKKFNQEYEKKKFELRKIREVLRDIRKKRLDLFFDCFNSLVDILTKIMACFNQTAQLICNNKIEPYLKDIKYFILKDQVTPFESLSGGEKALALFAFIFSINIWKGSSFCFFDEIDAALDKEYAIKLSEMLDSNELHNQVETVDQSFEASRIGRNFLKKLQIICISHKKDFFLHSDSLIGVYKDMKESRVIGYAFN